MGIVGSPPLYGPFATVRPVYLSAGEYKGLLALKAIAQPQDVVATNRHDMAGVTQPGRSYAYFPILERRIVLEGYDFGEKNAAQFREVARDNALLFSTSDAGRARQIVDAYGIDFLVCRPGTNLQLASRLPPWLQRLDNTGSLVIYEVLR